MVTEGAPGSPHAPLLEACAQGRVIRRSLNRKVFDIETSCNESCNQPGLDPGLRDRVSRVEPALHPVSVQVKGLSDE